MKSLIIAVIGACLGAFATHYVDNAEFAASTNAHLDSAIAQGAQTAHSALTAPAPAAK